MENRILVDTNILIYSLNTSTNKHRTARKFLSTHENLVLAHQNILETYRVITHSKYLSKFKNKINSNKLNSFFDFFAVISPNDLSLHIFTELIEKYDIKGNRIFDAYLVSTALSNDIKKIATDNEKDFNIYEEVQVTNPFIK